MKEPEARKQGYRCKECGTPLEVNREGYYCPECLGNYLEKEWDFPKIKRGVNGMHEN
jgi:DNA-directed RNA polymerase subunit RPC12/RpoP